MSIPTGEVEIAVIWKPLMFVVGIIFALVGVVWKMFTARVDALSRKVNDLDASSRELRDNLNKDYHNKEDIDRLIVLYISPLKDSLDNLTRAIIRVEEKMDRKADKGGD